MKRLWHRWMIALRLAARRLTLRTLRKLVDVADERLHAAEVRFREEMASREVAPGMGASGNVDSSPCVQSQARHTGARSHETFAQWEMRRSGVAVVSKKEARRRGSMTATAFDLRFAR